jgi:hypothetical protein
MSINPNLTQEQKDKIFQDIKGGYHEKSGDIALNDKNIDSTGDAVNTLGHELGHNVAGDRTGAMAEGYASIMGEGLENYANFGMYNYGDGEALASANNHKGLRPPTSVFDPQYKANQEFERRVDNGEVDYSSLVFDRSESKVYFYSKDKKLIGTFPATNIPDSKSNGKWTNGNYKYSWHNPHKRDSEKDSFGKNGNFIFETPNLIGKNDGKVRTGMGIHSGRADGKGWKHPTKGCVRITLECTSKIKEIHYDGDKLTDITIKN